MQNNIQDIPYSLFSPIRNNSRYFKVVYMYSRYKWNNGFHPIFTSVLVDSRIVINARQIIDRLGEIDLLVNRFSTIRYLRFPDEYSSISISRTIRFGRIDSFSYWHFHWILESICPSLMPSTVSPELISLPLESR